MLSKLKAFIESPYVPRYWSWELHTTVKRWILLIIHRRGGKTTAAFNKLQQDALEIKNSVYAYIAPTHRQAKRIVWRMAKMYSGIIPGIKVNESELTITYPNGSLIIILGAINADTLRGMGLWGCFLDEYAQMSPVIFTEIITKCLADHEGYCIIGGTPKGKGHFYRMYQAALRNPDRFSLTFKTIDESLAEESGPTIDMLRRSMAEDRLLVKDGLMTEDEFMQEWYLSWDAAIRGAIYLKELALLRSEKRLRVFPYDDRLPVFTIWDLGISKGNQMAIGFFQRGTELRMIDYYENVGLGMAHYIKYVKEKKYIYGGHFAPHDIKQRELSSGKTLLDTSKRLGIEFQVVPLVSVADGIDLTRSFINRLHVNAATCDVFIDIIGHYRYVEDKIRGRYRKTPYHDFSSNAADMLRYAAVSEEDMVVEKEIKTPPPPGEVLDEGDEYVGHQEYEEEYREGFGKHPMTRGINIGALGTYSPAEQEHINKQNNAQDIPR